MDVTAHELRTIRLREAFRGYRQEDVDQLIDRVAATIERLEGQTQRLTARLEQAESEAGLGREADEMLRRTLLLAQRTADAAVAEAQERARRVLSESEAHAHSIVSGAEEEARRIAIAERQRIENEIRDLTRQREVMLADVEALEQAARDHRRRLREFLESELARVDARPLPEASPPPEAEAPAGASPADAALGAGAGAQAPSRSESAGDDPALDVAEDEHAEGEAPVQDEAADAAAEIDLVGDEGPDMLPSKRRRWRMRDSEALPEAAPPDDRFFDDLRQAVQDDTPLGPRDEIDDDHPEWSTKGEARVESD